LLRGALVAVVVQHDRQHLVGIVAHLRGSNTVGRCQGAV
jgi:hypothetical protein